MSTNIVTRMLQLLGLPSLLYQGLPSLLYQPGVCANLEVIVMYTKLKVMVLAFVLVQLTRDY